MNQLNNIILSFSEDETNRFLNYLTKKNKVRNTKNIELFKLIRNNISEPKKITIALYGKHQKTAYHALRKRLYESILNFITINSFKNTETNSLNTTQKHIISAKVFLEKRLFDVAFKLLKKGEKIAYENHHFSQLNEIYQLQLQFINDVDLQLNDLLYKIQQNKLNQATEENLTIAYARINQKLNIIITSGNTLDFWNIITSILEEHQINQTSITTYKSFYQLISIFSLTAFALKNYHHIEKTINTIYIRLQKVHKESYHYYYHIQVLYEIANMHFRNKKNNEALNYLEMMMEYMLKKKKKHFITFRGKHAKLKSLVLNYSGKNIEAITIAEDALKLKENDLITALDLKLCLASYYFHNENYKKTGDLLRSLYHSDKWYASKVGIDWVMKKNLMFILLQFDNNNLDIIESLLLSFKRAFFGKLKANKRNEIILFVKLIEEYYKHPEKIQSNTFYEKVMVSFKNSDPKKEDLFMISFYAWLKCKMNSSPLYTTTLNILNF